MLARRQEPYKKVLWDPIGSDVARGKSENEPDRKHLMKTNLLIPRTASWPPLPPPHPMNFFLIQFCFRIFFN